MSEMPPVTFALGMASNNGSPPYPVLSFDDGVAVSLHAVRALAAQLGQPLPQQSLFELVQDWDRTFPALAELVQILAYDDRARGHRGQFIEEDLLTSEQLIPEARQIFRVGHGRAEALPVTVQGGASSTLTLDEAMQKARPNFCLAAVLGRTCRGADEDSARAAIAGWTLATELVRVDGDTVRRSAPGSLILGPQLVPAAFAGPLEGIPFMFRLMLRPVREGILDALARPVAAEISELSQDTLLLPGDVIVAGPGPAADTIEAGHIDVIEAAASGFGRQQVSLQ